MSVVCALYSVKDFWGIEENLVKYPQKNAKLHKKTTFLKDLKEEKSRKGVFKRADLCYDYKTVTDSNSQLTNGYDRKQLADI